MATHCGLAGYAEMLALPSCVCRVVAAPHYVEHARLVTVNGWPGVLVVQDDKLLAAIAFTVANGLIAEVDAVYNPDKLRHLDT